MPDGILSHNLSQVESSLLVKLYYHLENASKMQVTLHCK